MKISTHPILLLMACCCLHYFASAQVTYRINPDDLNTKTRYLTYQDVPLATVTMPAVDVEALLKEDKEAPPSWDKPFRFGDEIEVNLNLNNSGNWTDLKDGGRVWTLKIISKGAYSINLQFDRFSLPEGAELYIYNGEKTMLQGPITQEEQSKNYTYGNDLLQGESVVLEYYEPQTSIGQGEISISKVIHGYIDTFETSVTTQATACDNNIKCYSQWGTQSDGVCMILIGEFFWGTAFLINTTNNNPYLMTARHTINSIGETNFEANAIFRFQYKNATCSGGTAPTTYTLNNGGLVVVTSQDVALVTPAQHPATKLATFTPPLPFTYLGWSIKNTIPAQTAAIHHQKGETMKISFGGAPSRTTITNGTVHVWAIDPTNGVIDRGSSGAPFFDNNTKKVTGVVSAVQYQDMQCDENLLAYSNRLESVWPALCPYLDPGNTGAVEMGQYRWNPSSGSTFGTTTVPTITNSSPVCTTNKSFTLQNAPIGVTWSVTPSSLVAVSSGSGTTATIRAASSASSGSVQLKFSIPGYCKSYTKTVQIGAYNGSQIVINAPYSACPNEYVSLSAGYLEGVDNYDWTWPSGWTYQSGEGTRYLDVVAPSILVRK